MLIQPPELVRQIELELGHAAVINIDDPPRTLMVARHPGPSAAGPGSHHLGCAQSQRTDQSGGIGQQVGPWRRLVESTAHPQIPAHFLRTPLCQERTPIQRSSRIRLDHGNFLLPSLAMVQPRPQLRELSLHLGKLTSKFDHAC